MGAIEGRGDVKTLHVTFPVLRGARRFHIEKGRRWSLIEHVLLDAIWKKASSAADLAAASGLPRRVVVEAFVRLMRAGWVEMVVSAGGLTFNATALGATVVGRDQLPAATRVEPGYRGFAIEQITGGVFRSRGLDLRPRNRLPVSNDDQIVVHLTASEAFEGGDLSEVFTAIEGEDELIVGVDRSSRKLVDRYAVVTVRENLIEGLPNRASTMLKALIQGKALEAIAAQSREKGELVPKLPAVPKRAESSEYAVSKPALYEHDDLIVDGNAHKDALERTIRKATERVIIHSTFVTDDGANRILPFLLQAATKGTAIDILWGQDEIGTATTSSQAAIGRLDAKIAESGRSDSIRIHPFSTNSHAKFIIADNGTGRWLAVLGSCNWLASDFSSFEVSARLRDPALVGELVRRLGALSRGRPGIWGEHSIGLTVLGRRIAELPRGAGRTVPMRLLFSPHHAKLTLEARDRAEQRIFVLSHRFGIAGQPVSLLPILSAVKAKSIDALAYYGRTTGALTGVDGADLTRALSKQGVTIQPVHKPRLHAKVLGWDDNVLAVSSLNWLSADPPEAAMYREIGVLIEAPRIADNFIRLFEHARVT